MKFSFTLPENTKQQTIGDLLEKTWLIPRKQRHFLRSKKHVWVNNESAQFEDIVRAGDQIDLVFNTEDFPHLETPLGDENLATIVYEDEHMVIANKPEGLKTHGNVPGEIAFQNHVAACVKQPVYVVHRLDQATSGLVLFAKNQLILPILSHMFEDNRIHREYLAWVKGHFDEDAFTIDQPIGKDRHDKTKRRVATGGQRAITHVEVLKRAKQKSLVKLVLDTGRTHQIRVHLSHTGHTILGDAIYGRQDTAPRLMLHAQTLYLTHPFTQENIHVSAPSQTFEAAGQQE